MADHALIVVALLVIVRLWRRQIGPRLRLNTVQMVIMPRMVRVIVLGVPAGMIVVAMLVRMMVRATGRYRQQVQSYQQ